MPRIFKSVSSNSHHFAFTNGGGVLHFQEGPVLENGINGTQAPDVLEAIVGYLQHVSKPPHNTRETSIAITKIEEAIMWLDKRTADREIRGVEGTDAL